MRSICFHFQKKICVDVSPFVLQIHLFLFESRITLAPNRVLTNTASVCVWQLRDTVNNWNLHAVDSYAEIHVRLFAHSEFHSILNPFFRIAPIFFFNCFIWLQSVFRCHSTHLGWNCQTNVNAMNEWEQSEFYGTTENHKKKKKMIWNCKIIQNLRFI